MLNSIATRFAVLSATISISALGLADSYAKTVWQDSVTGNRQAYFKQAIPLPGGDSLWIGDREDANGLLNLWVRRYNALGGIVWNKMFPSPVPGGVLNSISARPANGSNVVIGCRSTGATTPIDLYLVKIDPDGNLVNSALLDLASMDILECMDIGPGNSVAVGISNQNDRYQVVKLDANFSPIWSTMLGVPGKTSQWPSTIRFGSSSDIYVCGTVNPGPKQDVQIDRLNSATGLSLYSKTFGDASTQEYYPTLHVSTLGDVYFGYTHHLTDPDRRAKVMRIDSAGNGLWTLSDPMVVAVNFAELPGGEMVAGGATFPSPGTATNRVFRFGSTGAVAWTRDLSSPYTDQMFTSGISTGTDGSISIRNQAVNTANGNQVWAVNTLTQDGYQLYHWKLDLGAGVFGDPSAALSQTNGSLIVGGYMGSIDTDAYLYSISSEAAFAPANTTVRLGRLNSGNVGSLELDDNSYLEMCKFIVPNLATPPINIEVDGVTPFGYPVGQIELYVKSKAGTTGLTQNVELWNWTTNAWERSNLQPMTLSEQSSVTVGLAADYIQPGTRAVKSRIRVSVTGLVLTNSWCTQFDQVNWIIRP